MSSVALVLGVIVFSGVFCMSFRWCVYYLVFIIFVGWCSYV